MPEGIDRPAPVVEVEARGWADEVHVGFEIRIERAHIAPVGFASAGVDEVVRVDGRLAEHGGDDILAEIVRALGAQLGIGAQATGEFLGVKNVDAHRTEATPRLARELGAGLGLFFKADDAVVDVDTKNPEAARLGGGDLDGADRQRGTGGDMLLQHATVIHAIDVVARQDQDMLGARILKQVEVLVDRIRGAHVPLLVAGVVRRRDADELLEPTRQEVPAETDVLLQAARLVLGQHMDPSEP